MLNRQIKLAIKTIALFPLLLTRFLDPSNANRQVFYLIGRLLLDIAKLKHLVLHMFEELLGLLGSFKQCSDLLGMKLQAFESSKEVSQKDKSKYLEKMGKIFQKVAQELSEENTEEEYSHEESYAEEVHIEDDADIYGQQDDVIFNFGSLGVPQGSFSQSVQMQLEKPSCANHSD